MRHYLVFTALVAALVSGPALTSVSAPAKPDELASVQVLHGTSEEDVLKNITEKKYTSVLGPSLKVMTDDVRALLDKRDFKALDSKADEYRRSKSRLTNGMWNLSIYYKAIGDVLKVSPGDANAAKEKAVLLQSWLDAMPESPTAVIVNSLFYANLASALRGSSALNDMEKPRFELFTAYINKAHSLLLERKDIVIADPEHYVLMLRVAQGKGWEKNAVFALLDEAYGKEPGYNKTYTAATYYFIMQSDTAQDDIGALAQWLKNKTEATDGNIAYVRVIADACTPCSNVRGAIRKNWQQLKLGFMDLLSRYPDKDIAGHFAQAACVAGDKPVAKAMLDRVGNDFDPTILFQDRYDSFDFCRKWIYPVEPEADLSPALKSAAEEKLTFAGQGDANAAYELSLMYSKGKGVQSNQQLAFDWMLKAAKSGLAKAKIEVASLYVQRNDFDEAVKWYKQAAKEGNIDATLALAKLYNDLHEQDMAIVWYRAYAKALPKSEIVYKGKPIATLGKMLVQSGKIKEGMEALKLAAEYGNGDSAGLLGRYLAGGKYVAKDSERGFFWITFCMRNSVCFTEPAVVAAYKDAQTVISPQKQKAIEQKVDRLWPYKAGIPSKEGNLPPVGTKIHIRY